MASSLRMGRLPAEEFLPPFLRIPPTPEQSGVELATPLDQWYLGQVQQRRQELEQALGIRNT